MVKVRCHSCILSSPSVCIHRVYGGGGGGVHVLLKQSADMCVFIDSKHIQDVDGTTGKVLPPFRSLQLLTNTAEKGPAVSPATLL